MKNNNRPKNVLMIVYYFPPLSGGGVQRPLKFAKYLPQFGWSPIILTVKNPDWHYAIDNDLTKDIPKSSKVIKTKMFKSTWFYYILNPLRIHKLDKIISKYLIQPDNQIGWIPLAYLNAKKLISQNKVKCIYTTSGPFSSHIIGYLLKKRTNIPWVADFRDEWVDQPGLDFASRFHKKLHFNLEEKIVKNADKIISTSSELCKMINKHYNSYEKFTTITNGYDPDDFALYPKYNCELSKKDKFIVSFVGTFHTGIHPKLMIKAINSLINEKKISKNKITIRLVGANDPGQVKILDSHKICTFKNYVSHKKAIDYLFKSNLLLLLLSDKRGKAIIPGKVFEYMASERPILALVPPKGEVAKIIEDTQTGTVVKFNDLIKIKEVFLEYYINWLYAKHIHKPNRDKVEKFNRQNLTKDLSQILNEIS
jgi:glycosyltransferase involved in cell wall biosynthesis